MAIVKLKVVNIIYTIKGGEFNVKVGLKEWNSKN